MSKKSRKKRKPKQCMPNAPSVALLRPRLDELLSHKALSEKDSQTLKGELDTLFNGLKASDFLPVLVRAYGSAPVQVQHRLDDIVPEWLNEHGYIDTLLTLLKRHTLYPEGQQQALAWLESAGVDASVVEKSETPIHFYQAYTYADGSQGLINVFWYTDDRKQTVRGLGFLIDFNPPWEGAVKDVMVFPSRSPERAIQEFVKVWDQRNMPLRLVSEAEVKQEILKSLEVNRREGIRLPPDLIRARNLFFKHVLALSDTSETPSFTIKDFDKLSRAGQSTEEIRRLEQQVGRRVRLENGKEVFVMGAPFDEDEWE